MPDDRTLLAEDFLREAVYRSRAGQSASTALRKSAKHAAAGGGECGLGAKAAVDLDLSDRGLEIFELLFGEPRTATDLDRLRDVIAGWVREQDALDRRRNHFLKAFRAQHGFDRASYSRELLAEFEGGLAEVNRAEDDGRRAAALTLLACDVRAS